MAGKRPTWILALTAAAIVGLAGAARVTHAMQPAGYAMNAPPHAQERQTRSSHTTRRHEKKLTLEQAVARVQNQVGGKVLKADSRNLGRYTEYRIKVLTPEGHVRVLTLRSDGHGD